MVPGLDFWGLGESSFLQKSIHCQDGSEYEVTVRGSLPGDCELSVEEVTGSEYQDSMKAALEGSEVTCMEFLDISLLRRGAEVEPKEEVEVLGREDLPEENGFIYHFENTEVLDLATERKAKASPSRGNIPWPWKEEGNVWGEERSAKGRQEAGESSGEETLLPMEKMASFHGNSVTFKTSSFSVFGVIYAIEKTYISASGETYKISVAIKAMQGFRRGHCYQYQRCCQEAGKTRSFLRRKSLWFY